MVFETGKYYEHSNGMQLYVCSETNGNLIYNDGLIAINGLGEFNSINATDKSVRVTAIQNPDKFTIVGETTEHASECSEIEQTKFRSLLGLDTSVILSDGFSVGKFYKGSLNGSNLPYSIHIIGEIRIDGRFLKIFECNSNMFLGNSEIEHDIDIVTTMFKDFEEISKSEFKLLNHIYKGDNGRANLIRDVKLHKLLANGN